MSEKPVSVDDTTTSGHGSGQVRSAAGTVAGNDRIVAVINALVERSADGAGWGVRQLALAIEEHKSATHRILAGLTEARIATQSHGVYSVGPRLRVLLAALRERHVVFVEGADVLADLERRVDSTVLIAMYGPERDSAFVAVVRETDGPIRYTQLRPGAKIPLHAGAAGRALLSLVGCDVLDPVELQRFGDDTPTDRAWLREITARAAQEHYTVGVGEHIALAADVASPVTTAGGEVLAVAVVAPRFAVTPATTGELIPLTMAAAQRLATGPTRPEAVGPSSVSPTPVSPTPAAPPPAADGSALTRVVRLIDRLVTEPAGVPTGRQLSAELGSTDATTARLVKTALRSGIAQGRGRGSVAAGAALVRWAALLGERPSLDTLLADDLVRLAGATQETAALLLLDPAASSATMTTVVDGPTPVNYGLAPGSTLPLHTGSGGKAILAFTPAGIAGEYAHVVPQDWPIDKREQLRADCALIRDRGYALTIGERIPDALGISAPFFVGSDVAGALTLTIPRYRAGDLDLVAMADAVVAAARTATTLLST